MSKVRCQDTFVSEALLQRAYRLESTKSGVPRSASSKKRELDSPPKHLGVFLEKRKGMREGEPDKFYFFEEESNQHRKERWIPRQTTSHERSNRGT